MTLRALIFFVLIGFVATVTERALAQTMSITVNPANTTERRPEHDPKVIGPTDINYDDCLADDWFGVKVTVTGVTTTSPGLRVYTGLEANCANSADRPSLGAKCWLVYSSPTVPSDQFDLPVRDIIPHNNTPGTEEDCELESQASFTLHFILFDGDQQLSITPATLAGKWDLKGPAAPTATGIGIGDTRLYPTWNAATEDPRGYRLFCEKTDMDPDAGTCTAPTLQAGVKPPKGVKPNATATQFATEGEVTGLTNNEQYACGVGTIDALQNVGPLSAILCAVPKPITGYFKLYRNAGGQGGGGYCAFGQGRSGAFAGLAAVGLAAAFLAVRRRRREERS